jgi:hypothetical protein
LKEDIFYKIRQPVTKLSANMIKNISDKAIQRIISERFEREGKNFAESLLQNPLYFNGKPIKSVSVNVNGKSLFPLHSAECGRTGKFNEYGRKVDFVYNSINYSFYVKDGKKQAVPLLQALNRLNNGKPDSRGFHLGDRVLHKGKQYFICGVGADYLSLRPVYTLLAENAVKLSAVSDIEKLKKQHIPQV